jgi:hypothetical protein
MVGIQASDKFDRIWEEAAVVAQSKYYPAIFLGRLRKGTKSLSG